MSDQPETLEELASRHGIDKQTLYGYVAESAAKRKKIHPATALGRKYGLKVTTWLDVVDLLIRMRDDGMTYPEIARQINETGVRDPRGEEWRPRIVRAVVDLYRPG